MKTLFYKLVVLGIINALGLWVIAYVFETDNVSVFLSFTLGYLTSVCLTYIITHENNKNT